MAESSVFPTEVGSRGNLRLPDRRSLPRDPCPQNGCSIMGTTFLKPSRTLLDRRAKNSRDAFQAQRIRSHRSNPANRSRQRGPLASSCEIEKDNAVQGYLPLLAKEAKLDRASGIGIAVNMVKEDGAIGRFTAVFAKGGSDESLLKPGKENATTLTIPASRKSQTLQVIRFSGKEKESFWPSPAT